MKQKILHITAFVVLLSFIPGLSIWTFGKRQQAAIVVVALLLSGVLFLAFPAMVTWYLMSIIYLSQMVYSAWLSILHRRPAPKVNANQAFPLPEPFRKVKHLNQAVSDTLSTSLGPNRPLISAVLAVDTDSSQHTFFGVTETDLIIAPCTQSGEVANHQFIPKDAIAWVNLEIGFQSCIMNIRFEEEQQPTRTYQISGRLHKEAIRLLQQFPGNWEQISTSLNMANFIDALWKLNWSPHVIIVSIISMGLLVFGFIPLDEPSLMIIAKLFSAVFGCFIFPWPLVIWFLGELEKDRAITLRMLMPAVLTFPAIFWFWDLGIRALGTATIGIIELLK